VRDRAERNLEVEIEHAARELAERYEEINLLYTISEILGRTVALEEAAATILEEISQTVGARRASILVYDKGRNLLEPVAALGNPVASIPPVSVADDGCVSARVFRDQHPLIVEAGEMVCDAEAPYRQGSMLSVPIMWTGPSGAEPLGVVNLSDRRSTQPFTAGDLKLVAAIATQIGTAIQNARLVRASIEQQRLLQEVHLAHDLQMKLLPNPRIVAPEAQVAARVIPAESVGGDFYNLIRLGHGKTGVMIGDVSSHGYRAALIMALAMSAAAIHAQQLADPAEALAALLESLREELTTTEMFISFFYGVVDPTAGELRYANTGHPHAFIVRDNGDTQRLAALDPPLGMTERLSPSATVPWRAHDLLLLFTDGVSDARNDRDERLGEQRVVDTVVSRRQMDVSDIARGVFGEFERHLGAASPRDDLTVVLLRT
jgi:phosphoserine phosphatase RsbU/P